MRVAPRPPIARRLSVTRCPSIARRLALAIGASVVASACAPAPGPVRLEDWMRVGVDPTAEAERVERTLVEGGYRRVVRVEEPGVVVALGFEREDGRRAVRVVTARGVVATLDSHEPDGVRVRHGAVSLLAFDDAGHDVDGEGHPEIVVAREHEGRACLAVLRVDEEGRATLVEDDAAALSPGACVRSLEDVDGDGPREALVELRWPELSFDGQVPSVRAALALDGGAFRVRAMPVVFVERERAVRVAALEEARARLDVGAALRVGIELAALGHLTGASIAAQTRRFDDALSGLVLSEAQLSQVRAVRIVIAGGWRRPED